MIALRPAPSMLSEYMNNVSPIAMPMHPESMSHKTCFNGRSLVSSNPDTMTRVSVKRSNANAFLKILISTAGMPLTAMRNRITADAHSTAHMSDHISPQ